MSEFEKGLTNVMGSFMEVNLDCVEKQNQEIEQLKKDKFILQARADRFENIINKVEEFIKEEGCYEEDTKIFCDDINCSELPKLLEILDRVKEK